MQWAFEHLNITPERIAELGATGLAPPLKLSCADHEGGGWVMFQQWDGNKWVKLGDPIEPMHDLTSAMIKEAAAKYAAEKGITPRDCSKEG